MRAKTLFCGVMFWSLVHGAASTDVWAQRGIPSEARLAEMGLAGIEILSDAEASTVRVSGRPPNRWGDLYPFVHGLSRLDREPARRPLVGIW
jgi:hypothetical protein